MSTLDAIRQPEYTGENRCVPCTAVNLALGVLLAAAVAVVSPPAAVVAFAAAVGAIYLRGYLVPGTPTLTKRYLPDRVLRWFDKAPEQRWDPDEEVDPEAVLLDAGAITEDPEVDDVVLTDSFATAWHDRMAAIDDAETDRAELAALLGFDAEDLSVERHGAAFVARADDGRRLGQWESRAAFVADMAADAVLEGRYRPWEAMSLERRSQVLGALRLMLERCPDCDGRVELDQSVVESCCRSYDVVAARCTGCAARLLEVRLDDAVMDAA